MSRNNIEYNEHIRQNLSKYQTEHNLSQCETAAAFRIAFATYKRFMAGHDVRFTPETYVQFYRRMNLMTFQIIDANRDPKLQLFEKITAMTDEQIAFIAHMADLITKVNNVDVWISVGEALSSAVLYDK